MCRRKFGRHSVELRIVTTTSVVPGLWKRGKMESRIRKSRFWVGRIVLQPFSNCGAHSCLQIQVLHTAWVEYTWRGTSTRRTQNAISRSLNCEIGLQGRGFQRKAQNVRCNSWMRARSSRSHAPVSAIGEANLESKNGAATCGTCTQLEF